MLLTGRSREGDEPGRPTRRRAPSPRYAGSRRARSSGRADGARPGSSVWRSPSRPRPLPTDWPGSPEPIRRTTRGRRRRPRGCREPRGVVVQNPLDRIALVALMPEARVGDAGDLAGCRAGPPEGAAETPGLPVTMREPVKPCCIGSVSTMQAMVCSFVPTSGAGCHAAGRCVETSSHETSGSNRRRDAAAR